MPIRRPPPKGGFYHGCRFAISDEAVCKVNRSKGYSVTGNWRFVTCPDCISGKKKLQEKTNRNPRLRSPF